MVSIRLYNTLSGRKEEFIPRASGEVSMYVCGPTTYNYIHLGNARPLVVFDSVRRYFRYRRFKVTYVQNFTDIDDKIINKAREEGIDPLDLAEKYIIAYFRDADALGVERADIHPRVSQHLPAILEMVEKLVDKGHAYVLGGDVYFDVRSFNDYGKLSGRSLEEMLAGARVQVDERKRDPMDFALWKAAKEGEPAWDSPWGPGRPGWHIECSAMSLKYLGQGFDIHGGGFDLIFPHHENEIAQSEAYTGQAPFARYWMHNGFITVNQEKMSKSLGNFFIVRDILERFDPEVVRFFLLSTHYRSPLDFDDQKLDVSRRSLERLRGAVRLLSEVLNRKAEVLLPDTDATENRAREFSRKVAAARHSFEEAMDDDFNTALAVAALFELAREVNSFINNEGFSATEAQLPALDKARDFFARTGEVLGMRSLTGKFAGGSVFPGAAGVAESDPRAAMALEELQSLVAQIRADARARKDWTTADKIRDTLKEKNIFIEDTPQGTRWKADLGVEDVIAALMDLAIDIRQEARSRKDWATADRIRDMLKTAAIVLEDTPQGPRWKWSRDV